MTPNPLHRLPAPLETALQRLKLAAREAVERTIESLGLAALAATQAYQRDGLLGAQFELNRKSALFALTFNEALDQRLHRELAAHQSATETEAPSVDAWGRSSGLPAPGSASSRSGGLGDDWTKLSLVEDQEVERQISADRFGMELAVACEWELREIEGYLGNLLSPTPENGEAPPNPLRPALIGHALVRSIEAVTDREDLRKLLAAEISRSLAALLRAAYGDIVGQWRRAGLEPASLAQRTRRPGSRPGPGGDGGPSSTAASTLGGPEPSAHGSLGGSAAGSLGAYAAQAFHGGPHSGPGRWRPAGNEHLGSHSSWSGRPLAPIEPQLQALIHRLNRDGVRQPSRGPGMGAMAADWYGDEGPAGEVALPPNLIRAHRDELRQAANGALDHLVIDVIGFMFDQILADPKLPPQLAREIGRLQLPVLRAALGDATFFSSRRHPVRRFINRIASLGVAYSDFESAEAREFLGRVRQLVQAVAEGDFEHIGTYERQLAALESHVADTARSGSEAERAAAALLSEKEDQARLQALYAERVAGQLKGIEAPTFLQAFIAGTWSRVLLQAATRFGADSAELQRLRAAGRELFLSVQPKPTPAHRKAFLTELPQLMQTLTQGLDLIGWPESDRRQFFGLLMPAHAEALKTTTGRALDINLMARQVEGALQQPLPAREELPPVRADEAIHTSPPVLSAAEAAQVGLVAETAVAWDGQVDILIGEDGAEAVAAKVPNLLPEAGAASASPTEAPEATQGAALAEHMQVGYPYQMHLQDRWEKVRLAHISPGRTFFLFTHGAKNRETVSLTQRMLVRLCESGRMKSYETSQLVERATLRARRQLAALRQRAAA